MHRTSLHALVHGHLYPHPRPNDPHNFASHLTRNLVPEVRAETQTFYGTLDCVEARYPGLDYTHAPHRMRLGRFTHHRRLFRAFDELGLTDDEILSLCRWEGTISARARYEREEGVVVRDTTGEEIASWVEPRRGGSRLGARPAGLGRAGRAASPRGPAEDDESDEEIESVGLELNQRLDAAAEARERGADVVMDEAWEQWLKEAAERGVLDDPIAALRAGRAFPPIASPATRAPAAAAPGPTSTTPAAAQTGTAMRRGRALV
ncbi:MAG: hypothetical protein M1832_004957 [Thelocarpon impressellum]|nr:MAG: hypothetical protein M1832_004957 [Thelocarpon impressellum]